MQALRTAVAACAAFALGAGAALVHDSRDAGAQEAAATVYVSGLRIDGNRARAIVRLTNTSSNGADAFSVHYTVQAANAAEPLSLPGAGFSGATLLANRTLDLDLGLIVTNYRKTFGLGPYAGTVRFVAYAEPGLNVSFGPDTVHVTAVQTEGRARYEPLVSWR